ncbi:MAG: hypothetical protein AAGI72_15275 [Pseudomonadota bacterium]
MSEFEGHTEGPWIIATSNSYRRVLTERRGIAVACAVVQGSDGHPDLHFPNGGENGPDARLIAAAPTLLAENAELLKDLEEARELLENSEPPGPQAFGFRRVEPHHEKWIERRDAFLHKTAPGIAQSGERDE